MAFFRQRFLLDMKGVISTIFSSALPETAREKVIRAFAAT